MGGNFKIMKLWFKDIFVILVELMWNAFLVLTAQIGLGVKEKE